MTDYSKTIIYKIQHETKVDLLYVGHTTNLIKRKNQHKHHCIQNERKLYSMIRDNGGWDSFKMSPILEFPCDNKTQAEIQEEKCRVELNATMNALKAHTTIEERKEQNKIVKQNNREKINDQQNIRYNELSIEERKKIAEERKEYKKEWYENNRHEICKIRSQKITCKCGIEYTLSNKARHMKTHK